MSKGLQAVFGTLLAALLGCQAPENGISPVGAIPAIPPKPLITNGHLVDFICHVDVGQHNPLNAMDYYLAPGGTDNHIMLFNYVVLGYAYLVKDPQGYVHLEKTPALKHVLDNNRTFLKPLREKGIKILIEVRSGNYAPGEDGIGLGMGTMDMAAIDELFVEFNHLIIRYRIDGYELNDIGGGDKAYPPYTRNVKRFQRDEPLYPDSLFQDENENFLSEAEITEILWREGGCNFANLIYRVYENMKESHNVAADYGSVFNDSQFVEIRRSLLVRDSGHGGSLIAQIRDEYMPDAYSGASSEVVDNMDYLIRGVPNDNGKPYPWFYNEKAKFNDGIYMEDRYGPLNIDLSDRLGNADATALAQWFRGGSNRYGAMCFSNLPSVSEAGSESAVRTYINRFTQELFGWTTRLYEGGGDYGKTW
ncbi:MAG: hypothetical protein FWH38_04570 [Treponema sp.]|nr:hypothetical protein [Treponema sp.]